ncbi:glycerol-3-phosphate dehydrogenase/oxidase [Nocardioides sp. SYSU D00065]|uniref:glycerol-3-phosphate dehydrogenase/oxidase n=1 Tax=Nocardioides sp. SYSU D00065 TaxID=2817378 RepID=UPI0027DDF279|nr:glycerol-3-phosphate dehydrogenase/oxidase [Nocardioides sp. SYSU D00065]
MTPGAVARGDLAPVRIIPGLAGAPDEVDVVVVGLGITGVGVALDAVTRGLSVLAVDAHDLAFGTSRWSSKLVHGGLRYLAQGQVAIAHESAVERGILMAVTAPHLVRPLPMLTPLGDTMPRRRAALTWAGLHAGDLLRRTARTSARTLPRPRRLNATEARSLAPSLRADTLRGGLLAWDGQLEDDARLVVNVARTAAAYGAHVRTRARATAATGTSVELRDELTGGRTVVGARAVVNATGVWAGDLDDRVRLRPSRGTHLVLRGSALHTRVAVVVPIPGARARFAMVLPQPDGTVYVGLTDEPVTGPVPDVPAPSAAEVDFLLDVVAPVFTDPPTRSDVVGSFAGLRPLLQVDGTDATADLSRRHAILTSATGVTTVVGGKLTTYRRMAADTLDHLVAAGRLRAGPCRTAALPLRGAGTPAQLRRCRAPARLVRRFGTDAELVLATAREVTGLPDDELLAPAAPDVPVTLAELVFAITDEGAHDADDLLDRRTRVGLVEADRAVAAHLAERALRLVAASRSALSRTPGEA